MSEDERKSPVSKDEALLVPETPNRRLSRTVTEESATAGAAALVGAALDGVTGIIGAAVVSVFVKAIFAGAEDRVQHRKEAFEREIALAAASEDPTDLDRLRASSKFHEAVYQNFRRAMDALDPEVIPALARLTWMYKDQPLDGFFRGWGRVLEDLSAGEFLALRELLSAVDRFDYSSCQVCLWKTVEGTIEMRLSPLRMTEPVIGYVPVSVAGVRRVLTLIERHDLAHQPEPLGADVAMVGHTELDLDICRRALRFAGTNPVSLFRSNFDRAEE